MKRKVFKILYTGVNNTGFYIHGGQTLGSAGCIDLNSGNRSFSKWFSKNNQPLLLKVDY